MCIEHVVESILHPLKLRIVLLSGQNHLGLNIAVNTRLLLHNKLEGIGWFTFETMRRITEAHPEHQFVYLFDRAFHESFITSENITPCVVPPPARHPLLWKLWFDYSIPRVIKNHRADLFLSPDGFLSQRLHIPQVPVIHDLNFEHYPEDLRPSHSRYYRKNFPKFSSIAQRIATVSEFSKADLVEQYSLDPDKIDVVYNGVNTAFQPSDAAAINRFKKEYTAGEDYFVFVGAMHPRKNIQRLLQAFDTVKQKEPGNYRLVLVGNKYWWNDDIRQTYEQMTHRESVVFTGRLSAGELQTALSGALALTFVPYFEGFGIPILEGFATHCPVITSNLTAMPEIAGNAALLVDPFSVDSIAEAMQKILQEPNLRSNLIASGEARIAEFSWDRSAQQLWNTIEKSLETP